MNAQKTVYVTTPIYYPSGKPHIGHAYSTYLAAAIAHYYQLIGYQTFFLTGSDDHGQKIEQLATKAQLDPLSFINPHVDKFKQLWKLMGIKYDHFIRTSDYSHEQLVQQVFSYFIQQDLVYLGTWTGWYCVACEENYAPNQVVNQCFCQHGHELSEKNEPCYFFKMSQFQPWLEQLFAEVDFLKPQSRKKELVNNFLKSGLSDLAVSRTSFQWGIQVKENPNHVVYVWIDALFNYLSALGFWSSNDQLFQEFWNQENALVIHVTAKEIARFHAIYWPILLKAVNVRMYDQLISHGWILTNNEKMSKSLGNVIDPFFILNHFPKDGFRYYLLTFSLDQDHSFSYEELLATYNSVLVNQYGNLIARLSGMVKKYRGGQIPNYHDCDFTHPMLADGLVQIQTLLTNLPNLIAQHDCSHLLNAVLHVLTYHGKVIETLKPWELYQAEATKQLNGVLYYLYITAVVCTYWYQPIILDTYQQALSILGLLDVKLDCAWLSDFANYQNHQLKTTDVILYQRLDQAYFADLLPKN